jgi:uncharacterized protein YuzE
MKLIYDPQYNIAYIALRDKTEPIETLQVSDELHIDLAPDGTIYGIELLNANQQLAASRYITKFLGRKICSAQFKAATIVNRWRA